MLQCQFILRCFQVSSNVPPGANILCEYFQNSQSGRGSDNQSPHHSPWSPPFLSITFLGALFILLSVREGVLYAVCCLTLFCKCSVAISYYCKAPFVKNIFFPDKYQSQFGTGSQMFSYYHEEDESSFQLVDTSRPQRPLYQRNKNRFGQVFFTHFIQLLYY